MKTTMIILEALKTDTDCKYTIVWYLANGEKLEYHPTDEVFRKIEKCYQGWQQINKFTKVVIL